MAFITSDIEFAVQELRNDNPVALPTETVYGLAANAESQTAVSAVFALKNRPETHPLIMHVAPEWSLTQWCHDIPDYVTPLIQAFWPGPLTFVLPCISDKIPALVRGGQDSIAVRSPDHPLFLQCLRQLGRPLVAPSANPFGKVSPTLAEHVTSSFADCDLWVVEGGRCGIGIESTIIDARSQQGFRILRPGFIQADAIEAATKIQNLGAADNIKVSGNLANHYQPDKPLYTFETDSQCQALLRQYGKKLFIIDRTLPEQSNATLFFQWPDTPEAAAFELYYQLRLADASNASVIAIRLPPETPAWSAVRERIIKASSK